MERNSKSFNVFVLCCGVFAVSWASIIIRFTDAHPFVITFYRLLFSVVMLLPFILRNPKALLSYTKKETIILFLSGLFLSLHFVFWISSLFYTTVAASLLMLSVQPLFTALFSRLALKEKMGSKLFAAMIVTFTGVVLIWAGDMKEGTGSLKGNVLAILGAVMVAAYLTAGRKLRANHGLVEYILPVYLVAALFTLPLLFFIEAPTLDLPLREYGMFALLAFVASLGGHGLFNWCLRHFKAAVVNLAALGEPVFAGFLAMLFLKEVPGINLLIGGLFILTGACIGVISDLKKSPT